MKTWTCLFAAIMVMAGAAIADGREADDISGPWAGEGYVQKDEKSRRVKVRCTIEGEQAGDDIQFEGVCRAMLIMKRDIGAKLTRSGDSFTGTYKGADAGIAQLAGIETGPGRLELTMTFPRKIHTDDKAIMMIDRPDENTFTIVTIDTMDSGEEVTTSSIRFERTKMAAN